MTHRLTSTFMVLGLLISLPSQAHDVENGDLDLKCSGRSFGGKPWKNTTFVKIRKKKMQATIMDLGEAQAQTTLYNILRYDDESITMCGVMSGRCRYQGREKEFIGIRVIDRLTGVMAITSFYNGTYSQLASWSCKTMSGF